MPDLKSQRSVVILGAALPLLCALKSTFTALLISVSVLCAVILFELIFIAIKRFWPRSMRFILALIVLSTVISAAWIAGPSFGFQKIAAYFPISLLSAVFLEQGSLREVNPFWAQAKIGAGFLVLSVLIGYLAESALLRFTPGFFWLFGLVVIVSNLINHKMFPHGS